MWFVAAILNGATLDGSGINFREIVNPLKLVANVFFCAHCVCFFIEGIHNFIRYIILKKH